jgi:putative membrane protein
MMGWHDGAWALGDWLAMAGMMLVLTGLMAAVTLLVVRAVIAPRRPGTSGPGDRATEARRILDERLARGEISEEDYAQRQSWLRQP